MEGEWKWLHKTEGKTTKPNHAPKSRSTKVTIKGGGGEGWSRLPMEVIKVAQYKAPHQHTKFWQTRSKKLFIFLHS